MSLILASVTFDTCDNLNHWKEIAQGLCKGEVGVKLQDRVDVFGEKPAELLENLLEEYDGFLLQSTAFELNDSQLTIHFEWPGDIQRFINDLKDFLLSCGAENLTISGKDLSSDY